MWARSFLRPQPRTRPEGRWLQWPYRKWRFHCLKSRLGQTICRTFFRLLNLDPALVNQICNHFWAVRHAGGFHPAGASKILHDLPLDGNWEVSSSSFARVPILTRAPSSSPMRHVDQVQRQCRGYRAFEMPESFNLSNSASDQSCGRVRFTGFPHQSSLQCFLNVRL